MRAARSQARERAWAAGARPGEIVLDFDAQLLECHTEKEGAAPHRKGGFGFDPLCCWLDGTGEALAGLLRPGNAGANDADDHVAVLDRALEQLPAKARADWKLLARADTAGATHKFAAALSQRKVRCSLGYPVKQHIGEAALSLPERRWKPALDAHGKPREGAWAAELTDRVDLEGWPERTRLICRKERPHPGAQLRFTDVDGHRYQCFITDQKQRSLARLELRHRLHARVEDRVQEATELGLGRLPFQALEPNQAWFELVLLAQDLLAWLRALVLDGETRAGQAQAASPSPPARRRAPHPQRSPAHPPPAPRLALGRRADRGLRPPAGAPGTDLTQAPSHTESESRANRDQPCPHGSSDTLPSLPAAAPPANPNPQTPPRPTSPSHSATTTKTRRAVKNRG